MRIAQILEEWTSLLDRQGKIADVNMDDVIIVGDIHGFPEVVYWVEKLWSETGARYLVFLGDYVDRGPDGPGVLKRVGRLVLSEPDRVVTLRGNHEDVYMNKRYGFYDQALEAGGEKLLEQVSRLYDKLPYAAASPSYFMVHGGIPCRRCSSEPEEPVLLRDIRGDPDWYGFHLMWNDPSHRIEWFAPSIRGAYLYGPKAWRRFLEANRLRAILRGHEVADAIRIHYNDRVAEGWSIGDEIEVPEYSVVTVFSSRYHAGSAGAIYVAGKEASVYRYT